MWKVVLGLTLAALVVPGAAFAQTGKHVALGAGVVAHKYVHSDFSQKSPGIVFDYRITLNTAPRDGWVWQPKGGLGWFLADTNQDVAGLSTPFGQLRARPIMAGIERAYRQGPLQVGLSAIAGPSFNRFSINDAARVAYRARVGTELGSVSVKNSLAARPEVSVWYDLGPWLALHGTINYMINRVTAETATGGTQSSTRWNTDHANFQIGLVVGIL